MICEIGIIGKTRHTFMYCDRQELIVIVHTIFTVRLTLIDHPQMGGKFTVTPGGLTQLILWLH